MKEVELYNPVKTLLESEGYDIRAEVASVDISAIKDDELLIVEMKTAFNMKLLMQAVKRQRMSQNVYIAIPRPIYKKRFSKDNKDREYLLRRLSIGLIYIILDVEDPYAVFVFPPGDFNMNISRGKTAKRTQRLLKEHRGRSENYNTGGSVRTKLVTAYRENSLKIAYTLKDRESMKTKELREAGCSDKTTTILYDNHYGWFLKVSRAEYTLSEDGEKALKEYREIVKHIVKDKNDEKN
ncbi:MAG: hypothetical protein KAH14_02050 [Clostridiales bacterium]|nr:hypothetical protein [Clostridiales bacterium]